MSPADRERSLQRTRLAARRVGRNLSQAQLARLTGISARTIRRLEAGQMDNPPIRYLVNCAIVLSCELDDVIEPEWCEWKQLRPDAPSRPQLRELGAGPNGRVQAC
jgi:transcriptional regulator with XRE-family HTH domain